MVQSSAATKIGNGHDPFLISDLAYLCPQLSPEYVDSLQLIQYRNGTVIKQDSTTGKSGEVRFWRRKVDMITSP